MHAADGGKDIARRAAELCGGALIRDYRRYANNPVWNCPTGRPCRPGYPAFSNWPPSFWASSTASGYTFGAGAASIHPSPSVSASYQLYENNRSIHGGNHHIIAFLNAAIFGSVIVNAAISCNLAVDKYMKIIVLKLIITRH